MNETGRERWKAILSSDYNVIPLWMDSLRLQLVLLLNLSVTANSQQCRRVSWDIYMSVCVCVCAYLWAWSFYDWRSVRFKPFRQISAETSSAGRDWLRTEHTHLSLRTHTCKNPHRRKLVLAGCVLIELSDTCLHGSQPTNTYHTLSTHTSEAKKFEKK